MPGVIKRKQMLTNIFQSTPDIMEVYSECNFDLSDKQAAIYLLCKAPIDTVLVFRKLMDIYGYKFKIYVTTSRYDLMLKDKKLIWGEGKWYV